MIPVKQIKPEDRKGKRTKEMEETFVSSHTYPSSNKQIRVMTQLQFEACNIRCKLDWIRNKRDKHLHWPPLIPAQTCKLEWWLSCCLMPSMHDHTLTVIKLDSDKEQDSHSLLRNDPANLATLLSGSVWYLQNMTANISQWQLEMSQPEGFLDEQLSTITMHYRNECITCNRSHSTILRKDSTWSWVKNHRSLRCIPHSIDLCDAWHTKL